MANASKNGAGVLLGYGNCAGDVLPFSQAVPAIISDDYNGVKDLTELVIASGYADIAVIVGPDTFTTSRYKLAGFNAPAEHSGFTDKKTAEKPPRIVFSDLSVEGGATAMHTLLSDLPQADIPSAAGP